MIIYKGTNKVNGKVYIGLTVRTLKIRLMEHKYKSTVNPNYLYRAIRKYGWDSFDWEVIDTANSHEELNEKEKYWISFHCSNNNKYGYNETAGGDGILGYSHSEETRQKMSASRKGHRGYMKGKRHTEVTKKKISEATKGKNNPMYGTKGELSPNYGKKHTEETKKLMSQNSPKGSQSKNAKLTEEKVKRIKGLLQEGITKAEIARRFNVSRATIINISKEKVWKHVS